MLVDAKIDPEELRTKEAKYMMTDLLCKSIGEADKHLGTRMVVEAKNKGYSIEEFCTALMKLAQQFKKVDDPFCNFHNGGGANSSAVGGSRCSTRRSRPRNEARGRRRQCEVRRRRQVLRW